MKGSKERDDQRKPGVRKRWRRGGKTPCSKSNEGMRCWGGTGRPVKKGRWEGANEKKLVAGGKWRPSRLWPSGEGKFEKIGGKKAGEPTGGFGEDQKAKGKKGKKKALPRKQVIERKGGGRDGSKREIHKKKPRPPGAKTCEKSSKRKAQTPVRLGPMSQVQVHGRLNCWEGLVEKGKEGERET